MQQKANSFLSFDVTFKTEALLFSKKKQFFFCFFPSSATFKVKNCQSDAARENSSYAFEMNLAENTG
jgi:hypothetical protein